jgi:hypothetical protein
MKLRVWHAGSIVQENQPLLSTQQRLWLSMAGEAQKRLVVSADQKS